MRAYTMESQAPLPAAGATLASMSAGREVLLVGIDAGCTLKGRLLALGLIKGAKIHIISNAGRGPLLIGIGENRMTIGRGMAEKIMVA